MAEVMDVDVLCEMPWKEAEELVKKHNRPVLVRIAVFYYYDENPDYSYLEHEYDEETKTIISSGRYSQKDIEQFGWETVKKWMDEDQARLAGLFEGDWHFIGIKVIADVLVEVAPGKYRAIDVKSGGIWGIESDSDRDYIMEMVKAEADEVFDELKEMNVYVPDEMHFEELVKKVAQ